MEYYLMNAKRTENSTKQLIITLSMLLFLLSSGNLYSQHEGFRKPAAMVKTASVSTLPVSELSTEILQSKPVEIDRNTLLSYSIPREKFVEIKLYDKRGIELMTVLSDYQTAGTHIILNLTELDYGTYYYQLSIGDYSEIKKIVL